MPRADEGLTYEQVADRVEAVLGARPSVSTLRAAAAVDQRGPARRRVTAGMPRPLQDPGRSRSPARFSASAVDRWLARHPLLQVRRTQQALTAAVEGATPAARRRAVLRAKGKGLSWQEVAEALGQADGHVRSRQWAQHTYGRD